MSTIINGTSSAITFPDSSVQNTSAIVSGYVPYANLPAGSVLQVVNATYGTSTSTTGTTYVDSGLTASITPKFSTSKVLVLVSQNGLTVSNVNAGCNVQLVKNSTSLAIFSVAYSYNANPILGTSICYLDSPATTSATTYKTQFAKFNGGTSATCTLQSNSDVSTITLMEIAA